MRGGSIRFAVTKLVTRRPLYRDLLQDSGRARWRRRRFASLAISPFSSSSPFRRVFLRRAFLIRPPRDFMGAYMRIPRWSLETRCGIIIKDKSLPADAALYMRNVCDKVKLLDVEVYSPCRIKSHTSDLPKMNVSFFLNYPRGVKRFFSKLHSKLLQVNASNFKLYLSVLYIYIYKYLLLPLRTYRSVRSTL